MKEQIEKQAIEEMAKDIDNSHWRIEQDFRGCHINSDEIAETLYNIGYRKQSEGEWIDQVRVSKEGKPLLRHYKCNLCGVYLATRANFCPNCGAHMKGGAE